ncbi:hypothetical protein BC938DRAFT_481987, partial [Jimgerdemannia flammicorona]
RARDKWQIDKGPNEIRPHDRQLTIANPHDIASSILADITFSHLDTNIAMPLNRFHLAEALPDCPATSSPIANRVYPPRRTFPHFLNTP